MRHIFEADEIALGDLMGDPSTLVEVQRECKLLLEANQQRQVGLKQAIVARGPWALPGIINASYVLTDYLKRTNSRKLLAEVATSVCLGNDSAADLLLKAGVIECPVPAARQMARQALQSLPGWTITNTQATLLKQSINRAKALSDNDRLIDLYSLLCSRRDPLDYDEVLRLCKGWAQTAHDHAGRLLAILVAEFPEKTIDTVASVIESAGQKRDDRRNNDIAKALVGPLDEQGIPTAWFDEGIVLDISLRVLGSTNQANRIVEYCWKYAVSNFKKQKGNLDRNALERIGARVQEAGNPVIQRYWFKSVGEHELNYVVAQLNEGNSDWNTQAATQLHFLAKDSQAASQELDDLKRRNPELHKRAEANFRNLINHKSTTTGISRNNSGPSGLEKRSR